MVRFFSLSLVGGLIALAASVVALSAQGRSEAAPGAAAGDMPLPRAIEFSRDVRPILTDNCYACHGPDKSRRKADLRLDTRDGLFAASTTDDETAIVTPGSVARSELYLRVTAADPAERMPEPKSNKRLSDREIAILKSWIEQGAPWEGHWAYLPPKPTSPPAVSAADRAAYSQFFHNPIDGYTFAQMRSAGLSPAPQADRATLIRRLSLDLTGLPPTWKQVSDFTADQRPDAYERLVDSLLASDHFGERMTEHWLDLVRYADSIGYHSDNAMPVSPYRDWVIAAFNSDMPFDEFTIDQLAGDLLPHATQEQKIASAYNRLLQTTEEGGAQAREYVAKYAADRVRNVSSVWMGATMGCCECHDHKFDPYKQTDFYAMEAFFADIQEPAIGSRGPGMAAPTPEQTAALKQLDHQIAAARAANQSPDAAMAARLDAAQPGWEIGAARAAADDWKPLKPKAAVADHDTPLTILPDDSVLAQGPPKEEDNYTLTATLPAGAITYIRLEALADDRLPFKGPGRAENGNFVLCRFTMRLGADSTNAATRPATQPALVPFGEALADHSQKGYPIASVNKPGASAGWAILPQQGKSHFAVFALRKPLTLAAPTIATFRVEFNAGYPRHQIGRLRISHTGAARPPAHSELTAAVRAALAVAAPARTPAQRATIKSYYRSVAPLLAPQRKALADLEARRDKEVAGFRRCLVSESGPPRIVRLLHRGDWQDETGQIMAPAVPEFLPQPKVLGPAHLTRLDLARWIVSRDNPLTARVLVNRLWALYFGAGISKSLEDFGSQGDWPVDPKLLDYLATQCMDSHWNIKATIRLIVTSGTYRQSSAPIAAAAERDPFNRLVSHQSRFRMDAETVRDNALTIAGLLNPAIGGPSVKPYQPAGYWFALNFPPRKWIDDTGPDQYRRGLYTWWQRSFLHPSLEAFDAPSREECTVERARSNIPQQALALLNDPTYVEASRALAQRIMIESKGDVAQRVDWAFQTAVARSARPAELAILSSLYSRELARYRKDKPAADALIAVGQSQSPPTLDPAQLAAWTSVARVIMNLSETITRS